VNDYGSRHRALRPHERLAGVWCVAIAALVLAACAGGSASVVDRHSAALQQALERYHAESRFPGAVAGAWLSDGSTVVAAAGVADRDRRSPMRTDALLHAGSVGKTLFAALALQLAGEGRVALDDPVSRYLGGEAWYAAVPNAKTITVRMLLNHTTGIPEYGSGFMSALLEDPGRRRTPLDAVQSVAGAEPLFPAGARFAYSDVNYQLLQLLEEKITGRSAYLEIRERLLHPLGLTRLVPADAKVIPGLVPGYAGSGFFLGFDAVMRDGSLVLDPAFEGGGGGFVANAGDLARWMALFGQGRAFPASFLPEVRAGVPAGMLDVGKDAVSGLGVEIVQTPLGPAWGHGGFFPGYLSLVLWYPDLGVSVAVQVNSSAGDALQRPLREFLEEAARALSAGE
jgi:D-alanyl-D-alanine carboxypeptidase